MVAEYEALWAALDIAPDAFIRTTDEEHAVRGCVVCGVWLGGLGGVRTGKERETGRGRGINGWIRRVEWNDLDDLDDVRFHASMHEDGRTLLEPSIPYTYTLRFSNPHHNTQYLSLSQDPLTPTSLLLTQTNKHTSSHHPDLLHTQIYRSTEAPRRRTLRLHPPLYFYLPPSLP